MITIVLPISRKNLVFHAKQKLSANIKSIKKLQDGPETKGAD